MDYKSSFKSHQQFKTNTIYIKIFTINNQFFFTIYIYLFVSCVYFENGSSDFDETNSINKF